MNVDDTFAGDLRSVLRNLLATIELHTDITSGLIDRNALAPYIEQAEDLLGESIGDIIQ
jgi:hypothetical protein